MTTRFTIVGALLLARAAAAQPNPAEMLDGANYGKSRAGARDCDKAKQDADKHIDNHLNDPQQAVFGAAKLSCSYFETIAWKPPAAKAAPASTADKDVVRSAKEFWATSDDRYQVGVVSGGTTGGWQVMEQADVKGVPSRRTISTATVIVGALADDKIGCFVVYGALSQKNLDHPDQTPPRWGATEYLATDWKRAEKLPSCPKGAKPPKPPKPGE